MSLLTASKLSPSFVAWFLLMSPAEPVNFVTAKSYLARADAFALDPIHLPLSDKIYTTSAGKGLFGVLADAGADAWGQRVILSLHKTKPENALQFLLAGSGIGFGLS
jgi:serine/threonine-protein kinase HipA